MTDAAAAVPRPLPVRALCWNLTFGGSSGREMVGPWPVHLFANIDPTTTNVSDVINDSNTSSSTSSSRDRHALLYIIVVLLFYSSGIVIAIVNYLKRERKEIEEDKAFDDYTAFRADPDKTDRYLRVQRMITYLNQVEKNDQVHARTSLPVPGSTSKSRPMARLNVGSDHVTRSPKRRCDVTVTQAEVTMTSLDSQTENERLKGEGSLSVKMEDSSDEERPLVDGGGCAVIHAAVHGLATTMVSEV